MILCTLQVVKEGSIPSQRLFKKLMIMENSKVLVILDAGHG